MHGELMITVALIELDGTYDATSIDATAKASGDGHILSGTKLFVPDANVADYILVVARTKKAQIRTTGLPFSWLMRKARELSATRSKRLRVISSAKSSLRTSKYLRAIS